MSLNYSHRHCQVEELERFLNGSGDVRADALSTFPEVIINYLKWSVKRASGNVVFNQTRHCRCYESLLNGLIRGVSKERERTAILAKKMLKFSNPPFFMVIYEWKFFHIALFVRKFQEKRNFRGKT